MDSKQLSGDQREALFQILIDSSSFIGVGMATHRLIGKVNILWATMTAMTKAVRRLNCQPDQILIDGNRVPDELRGIARAIVKGDQLEPCISAASIIAKVIRDRIMVKYEERYPGYGFAKHKGYATAVHYDGLCDLGPSCIHRPGFKLYRQLSLF